MSLIGYWNLKSQKFICFYIVFIVFIYCVLVFFRLWAHIYRIDKIIFLSQFKLISQIRNFDIVKTGITEKISPFDLNIVFTMCQEQFS